MGLEQNIKGEGTYRAGGKQSSGDRDQKEASCVVLTFNHGGKMGTQPDRKIGA